MQQNIYESGDGSDESTLALKVRAYVSLYVLYTLLDVLRSPATYLTSRPFPRAESGAT